MRVLVGCERSGTVRDAFRLIGHQAFSCDLAPDETGSRYHLHCDLLLVLNDGWDLGIFHPPCTHLSASGARWFDDPLYPNKRKQQAQAVAFARRLYDSRIPRVCIENPKGVLSSLWRKPDQIIDPVTFCHSSTKETHLWLKNLPTLEPPDPLKVPVLETVSAADIAAGRCLSHGFYLPKNDKRAVARSRTFQNIAWAMADQWGRLPVLPTN